MIRLSAVALLLALFGLSSAVYAAESTGTPKMVTCKDGTKSEAGQGACSHHGGVQSHKMVTCTDGTKSEAGQGACSHHGGVKPPAHKATSTTKPATKPTTSGTSSGSSAAHGGAAATDTVEPKGANQD